MRSSGTTLADRLMPDRVRFDDPGFGPGSGPGSCLAEAAPGAALPDPGWLRSGRVHEVAGSNARAFASALAGRLEGPVLWLQDGRSPLRLCPHGLKAFFDPRRLVLVQPIGALALLQVFEEALRSGSAPLVIAELERSPDLTQGRRLQLAAGTGGGRGLALVPEDRVRGGTAETRWHCRAILAAERERGPAGRWEMVKDKRGRPGTWDVRWDRGGFRARNPASPPEP